MAYYATSPSHLVWHEGRVLIPQLLLSEFGYFSDDNSDFEEGIWVDKQKAGYIDPPDPHSIEKTVWLWEEEDGWQVSVRHEVVESSALGGYWWASMDANMTANIVERLEPIIAKQCDTWNANDVLVVVLTKLLEWHAAQHPHADFLVKHVHRMVRDLSFEFRRQKETGEWYKRPSAWDRMGEEPAAAMVVETSDE